MEARLRMKSVHFLHELARTLKLYVDEELLFFRSNIFKEHLGHRHSRGLLPSVLPSHDLSTVPSTAYRRSMSIHRGQSRGESEENQRYYYCVLQVHERGEGVLWVCHLSLLFMLGTGTWEDAGGVPCIGKSNHADSQF